MRKAHSVSGCKGHLRAARLAAAKAKMRQDAVMRSLLLDFLGGDDAALGVACDFAAVIGGEVATNVRMADVFRSYRAIPEMRERLVATFTRETTDAAAFLS